MIESIVATSSVFSSTKSLEFFDMVHQVRFSASFSGCLDFSPEFLQISISPTNVMLLAVSEVRLPRKFMSFSLSLGVELSESIALHLPIAHDETCRYIAICNDDYKFAAFSYSIL